MSRAPAMVALLTAATAAATTARAEPDLRLRALPARPARLHMRTARAATPSPPTVPSRRVAAPTTRAPATRAPAATAPAATVSSSPPAPLSSLRTTERPRDLLFRFDLGYGVDGGALSDKTTLAGGDFSAFPGYSAVRGIVTNHLYLGSRGYLMPSLSTYLASSSRLYAARPEVAPLPTVYDRDDSLVRLAWAEVDGFFDSKLLHPVRLRAGRQYVYGPSIAHLDGLSVAWEQGGLALGAFTGVLVADYTTFATDRNASGLEARLDLAPRWRIPAVVSARTLTSIGHRHFELDAAYARPRKDLVVRASARTVDGQLARERGIARIQVSDVSQITVEIQHSTRHDWRWDHTWLEGLTTDRADRFLYLGPVLPRLTGSVRAGTVLFDNIDVLLRTAGAADLSKKSDRAGPFAADWVEATGSVEVRLRRALAVGASATSRVYDRPSKLAETVDIEDPTPGDVASAACLDADPATACTAMPFPVGIGDLGEVNFQQAALTLRYTAGARRFSASAEIYARRTQYTSVYRDDDPDDETGDQTDDASRDHRDQRGGGRFTLDAWPTQRLRVLAEYDVSTIIEIAPEIRGYKSLRLSAEATF